MSYELERSKLAVQLRKMVRQKAGLGCDWPRASKSMKNWYLMLAERLLASEGKVG